MTDLQPSSTLSVSIDNDPDVVFRYVTDPRNLPHWATGFALSVAAPGAGEPEWTVQTSDGPVRLRFADDNPYRVADHWVRSPAGEVMNPMRVLGNGSGAEVLFTLFRAAGVSDADHERDRSLVTADLARLAAVLARHAPGRNA